MRQVTIQCRTCASCGIYAGGMAGMWAPQGQKGLSPCPFCFVFITLDPKSWGWAGASSLATICTRFGERGHAECWMPSSPRSRPDTTVSGPQNVSVKGKVASATPCQGAHHI